MSNRVEELERKASELQAAVNGLTEELVETKERLRQLENTVDVDDPAVRAKPASEPEPEPESASAGGPTDEDVRAATESVEAADEDDAEPEQRFVDAEEHEQELAEEAKAERDEEAKATEEKEPEEETESEQDGSDIIVA
jgi:hypothetical protein